MGWGRVTETELMPRLVVGYTELGSSKWKKWKGFLKPNCERGPNPNLLGVRYDGSIRDFLADGKPRQTQLASNI